MGDIMTWKTVSKYRNLIYGFAAIWIVLYHLYTKFYWPDVPVFSQFLKVGNMGVDIFLFLSAVSLGFSIEKNTTKEFYKNRFKRVFITYLLIAGPFMVWKYFIMAPITSKTVVDFLLEISTLSYFWTKEGIFPVWYVPCIMFFYLVYPLLYKLKKKNNLYLVILIIVSILGEIFLKEVNSPVYIFTERTMSRIPIFLVGMLCTDYVKTAKPIKQTTLILIILSGIAGFVLTGWFSRYLDLVYERYLYAPMSIAFIVGFGYVAQKLENTKFHNATNKALIFCGAISLEIYLVHVCTIRILSTCNWLNLAHHIYYYIGLVVFSVAVSYGFSKLTQKILKA